MKKCLSLILVLSLCLSLFACSENATTDGDHNGEDEKTKEFVYVNYDEMAVASAADPLEVSYSEATSEDYRAFVDKVSRFAARLTYEVYSDSDKESNLCISPVSVYMALALVVACADGATRDEMLSAVGVTYDEVKSFTKVLYSLANQRYGYTDDGGNERVSGMLELANSIWADDGVALNDAGVAALAGDYHADLYRVDFESDDAENAIASYIKDKTHGLIDGPVTVPPMTLISLINTFYLKDAWNGIGRDLPFTEESYTFRNTDGSTVETRLLEGYYFAGRAYQGDGYTSFYTRTDKGMTLTFLLPDGGHTLDEIFTAENIYGAQTRKDYGHQDDENRLLHYTRVLFPEYEAGYDGDLAGILQNDFGILSAFDLAQGDFSGITEEKIALLSAVHKCRLIVDKKGIEGAAATMMDGGASGMPVYEEVYHDYTVDRGFGFVITDSFGSVLFSGAVNTVR